MGSPVEFDIDEDSFHVVTFTLQDELEVAIPAASVDSITLTLVEVSSGDVINLREAQDVLDDNNCTLHATTGLFTWNVQVADTDIVKVGLPIGNRETHLATFTVVYGTTKAVHQEIALNVKNLYSVPQTV